MPSTSWGIVLLHAAIRVPLDEFTLEVELRVGAEVVLVAGPSGAGKSSLLDALAGVRPAQGRVALDTRVWVDSDSGRHLPPGDRRVGYAFQDLALFPTLSARDNVAWGAPGSRAERTTIADRLLDDLDLVEVAQSRPGRLSGGQQRRVAVARALASAPSLLLLDEPLAGLDHNSRQRVIDCLPQPGDDSRIPTLIASHEPGDLDDLVDRVIILERGRITQSGSLSEIRRHPGTEYAATL